MDDILGIEGVMLEQLYDLTEDERCDVDFGRYTADQFLDDMGRATNYRCDAGLTDILS